MDHLTIARIEHIEQRRQANSRRWQLEADAYELERRWRDEAARGFTERAAKLKRQALQVRMEIGREAMRAYG